MCETFKFQREIHTSARFKFLISNSHSQWKTGQGGLGGFCPQQPAFSHLGLHFILLHTDTQSFLRHMTPDQGTDLTHTSNISVMPLYHKGRDQGVSGHMKNIGKINISRGNTFGNLILKQLLHQLLLCKNNNYGPRHLIYLQEKTKQTKC